MAANKRSCGCGTRSLGNNNMNIYTQGPLLDMVQKSGLYPDCKTFVDMRMRYPPDVITANFRRFCGCKRSNGYSPNLKKFIEYHFDVNASELHNWTPTDWQPEPPYVSNIRDLELKQFGYCLNDLWKLLGFQISEDVHKNPDMYSLLYLPNPFIAPGGRFMEYYYWDSYWIVIGLLTSGMYQTARGIIDNFLSLIQQYGFIPNGGRIYYSGRSQPPLLVQMIKAYVDATIDEEYAIKSLTLLETEFDTFLDYHKVDVLGFTMYQYRDNSSGPRPEAYREDIASGQDLKSDKDKEDLYTELKSACESGMNFSSRWFANSYGTLPLSITDIKTSSVVPVDLNCIIFRNCKTLAYFNKKAGNTKKSVHYQNLAYRLVKGIRDVFWNEEAGIWLDYDLKNEKPIPFFCVTNFYPLWMRAFPLLEREKISESVMAYIKCNNLDSYPGGVPVTLTKSNFQWDFPNVWPCMMYILIEGLANLDTPESKSMSKRWAHRWVKSNYDAYRKTGHMFEKYNCEKFGMSGEGGEYQTQTGFGWTNAIAIYYLAKYGMELALDDYSDGSERPTQDAGISEYIITSQDNIDNNMQESTNPAYVAVLGNDQETQCPQTNNNATRNDKGQNHHQIKATGANNCSGKCVICGFKPNPLENTNSVESIDTRPTTNGSPGNKSACKVRCSLCGGLRD